MDTPASTRTQPRYITRGQDLFHQGSFVQLRNGEDPISETHSSDTMVYTWKVEEP